jgi:hypothetical protein
LGSIFSNKVNKVIYNGIEFVAKNSLLPHGQERFEGFHGWAHGWEAGRAFAGVAGEAG